MISKLYIDMCLKSKEIQRHRPKKLPLLKPSGVGYIKEYWYDGDFVYITKPDELYFEGIGVIFDDRVCHTGIHDYDGGWYIPKGLIWLPRPDQIIHLLTEHHDRNHWGVLEFFNNWYDNQEISISENTLAEMWLMYYMKAVYNKQWKEYRGERKWI